MHVIKVRNVNYALYEGLHYLNKDGIRADSRNGLVIRAPGPVTTMYLRPQENVLWAGLRDANPFFHFLEALWMLAGRNDLKFPAHYAKQLTAYSDDGETLAAAYGHRWRVHFGYDQLRVIIDELKVNPESRRCVLQIWDGGNGEGFESSELYVATHGGLDTACNTGVYFEIQPNEFGKPSLNMTVTNRSNDAVWGAYGANAVHFSILLQYMAAQIGVGVGWYCQISNNFHVYTERKDVDRLFDGKAVYLPTPKETCQYTANYVHTQELINDSVQFNIELADFFAKWDNGFFATDGNCMEAIENIFTEPAFRSLAIPMVWAHRVYKAEGPEAALRVLEEDTDLDVINGTGQDWALACAHWLLQRRNAAIKQKALGAEAKAVGQEELK